MAKLEMPVVTYTAGSITANFQPFTEAMKMAVEEYRNKNYTENDLTLAKSDRATLNKVKKAINDKKIEIKKEFMKPYDEFEKNVKDVISIIDNTASDIDAVVKHAEEKQKEAKKQQILETWELLNPPVNSIESFWSDRWLNKTYSIEKIRLELVEICDRIRKETAYIMDMNDEQAKTDLLNLYTTCNYNLTEAQMKYAEIQRKKAEREAELQRMKEQAHFIEHAPVEAEMKPVSEPLPVVIDSVATERKTVTMYHREFSADLTREQLFALDGFCKQNGIILRVDPYSKRTFEKEI